MNKLLRYTLLLLAAFAPPVHAGSVTIPNTFTAGSPAVAAEVNANFTAVKSAVDDNDSRLAALEAAVATLQSTVAAQATTIATLQIDLAAANSDIATLQGDLAAVNGSDVMALDTYLTVDTLSDSRGPLVQLAGVNLQLINGAGSTATANGLGNLIVGYDEADASAIARCTYGSDAVSGQPVTDATGCTNAGGTWTSAGFKSGSHYLVLGSENNYSFWGGLLVGYRNTANREYATVSGGGNNTAGGRYSSVSGGENNTAGGYNASSVSGGTFNAASAPYASICGGNFNTASGVNSSVSGGDSNIASGSYASVSGGIGNIASGTYGTVVGGGSNTASGNYSAVLGGNTQSAISPYQTVPALP